MVLAGVIGGLWHTLNRPWAEGGLRETVSQGGGGGYLAEEPDPDVFAALLMRFTVDPVFAMKMSQQDNRHLGLCWSPRAAIDRLERHLLTIIGAR